MPSITVTKSAENIVIFKTWSYLVKKPLMENFFFVYYDYDRSRFYGEEIAR